ncbi:MAG TPA: hypothetical protein VHU90_01915, partial [Galbitalea sp.]|nr:hypothetical protein [Galbitalea sp.]
LARYGVVAYAPTYPLWSDNAGKLRHVRVPRGTSIQFDAATQSFKIPADTRFYKTFLKRVVDASGKQSYRKVETRLIVSRPDDCTTQPCKQTALMGTYAWNEDETEAPLMEDTLRDGTPFGDRVITYPTDEVKYAAAGSDAGALAAVSRHYAIPGKFRCVQCHMGSPSSSFILGFTPVQVNRKPYVEEPDMIASADKLLGDGVLKEDAPGPDELSQLQRLIDYGIITGISSPSQVKSLKEVEAVPPRNGYELQAQAYMTGNCAHCHNPKGFPSIQNPVLTNILNFLPGPTGGIFGFPLDRVSPRVHRLASANLEIPYITPSLYDGYGALSSLNDTVPRSHYSPKFYLNLATATASNPNGTYYVLAPWRSFIYRNADTPFTYGDDYAIFNHMPLNTAGYDCRAPQIFGDWMVSLPARRNLPGAPDGGTPAKAADVPEPEDQSAQPYLEVQPGEPGYVAAVVAARSRVDTYHNGERYNYCPNTDDIVDPQVLSGLLDHPGDNGELMQYSAGAWLDGVPDHPHWANTDTTEPKGPWSPRRGDWEDVLIKHDPTKYRTADEASVVNLLSTANIEIDEAFRSWGLQEQPFAFWSDPDGSCASKLGSVPTVASLQAANMPVPGWWSSLDRDVQAAHLHDHIYSLAPGPAVFQNICINCHGTEANGQSTLGATILNMTGGETRVADLKDGFFGPPGNAGAARMTVFGKDAATLGIGPDDLGLRYLLWMTLGGTQRHIPDEALIAVGNSQIAGTPRLSKVDQSAELASANMLNTARALCRSVLPIKDNTGYSSPRFDLVTGRKPGDNGHPDPLIETNGDATIWRRLCSWGRKVPVQVLSRDNSFNWQLNKYPWPDPSNPESRDFESKLYDPDAYGTAPVMTQHGLANGVGPDDEQAWCMDPTLASAEIDGIRNGVPYCPSPAAPKTWDDVLWNRDEQEQWATRGAMNAGEAVFVYLDAIAHGTIQPKFQYNECSKL